MKKSILLILLFCLFYPVIGSATTTVEGLTEPVGYAGMNGMTVTVVDGNGVSDIQTWGVTGTDTSGVTGTDSDWSLTFTGDDSYPEYYINQWAFQSTNTSGIDSIMINALAGNTVFDIFFGTTDADWYTVGSYLGYWTPNDVVGRDYTGTYTFGSGGDSAEWTFSDPVAVEGEASVLSQDVYGTLTIDFLSIALEPTFAFTLDTDHVVPEPTTILLFGLGLLGFSAISRKKQMA